MYDFNKAKIDGLSGLFNGILFSTCYTMTAVPINEYSKGL